MTKEEKIIEYLDSIKNEYGEDSEKYQFLLYLSKELLKVFIK